MSKKKTNGPGAINKNPVEISRTSLKNLVNNLNKFQEKNTSPS